MDMGNNTGIGFKIFGLFMVFVVAIVIDIAIFTGGIDLDEFSYIFDEIFYTDYEDDDWYMDCDYTFTYLDNEQYKLWNESNLNSMVYKISALEDELYSYVGSYPEEPEGIVYTYKLDYCGNTIEFNDQMDYLRFDDGDGIAIFEGSNYTDTLKEIRDNVASHMGKWNTNDYSDVILPLPLTLTQKLVHMCDYLASRKYLNIKFDNNNDILI